jgi:tetratricopeptide (TPR) repeat protein
MYHFLGDYKQAVSTFELALHDAPQLYVANLFLGLDLLNLHQPQRALSFLERACDLNKQDAQAQVGLGGAYLALGNGDKARDAYERAARIDPKSSDAWYGLGAVYLDLQESAVDRLAETGKESPYARDLVAHSLLARGQPDAAVNLYRELLKSKQTLPCLGANLGFAYILKGDFQSAEQAFQDERQSHPGCLLARLGLARLSLQHRNVDAALSELFAIWTTDENFLRENLPSFWAGLNEEAVSMMKKSSEGISGSQQKVLFGDFLASAIQAVQRETYEPLSPLAVISPRYPDKSATPVEALPSTGASPESLLAQGHYTECDRSLQTKRARLAPSDLRVLCACAYSSGDFRTSFLASAELAKYPSDILPSQYWRAKSAEELGVAALRQAGLVAPDSAKVHFLLAELYRQKYQEERAEAEYLTVIELHPNDLAAHLGLADAYSISMEFDKAIPELKRIFSMDPSQPDANYLMGNILVNQHQYSEAMPYLEIALKGSTSKKPLVHALISRVYASQGRTKNAISELLQALGADQDGSLHYQLSMLYRKVGDQEAAAAALEQSRALFRQKKRRTAQETISGSPNSDSKPTSQ